METRLVSFIQSSGPLQNNPDNFLLNQESAQDEDFVEQEMPEVFGKSKRKSLTRPIRDSLATRHRQRMGQPGSRKHNRFMNSLFLGGDGFDGDLENAEELLWTPEYHSQFEHLFADEASMATFLPFLEIDNDDQDLLLELVCGEDSDDSESEDVPLSPEETRKLLAESSFLSIDRDTRKLLKKAFNFHLIQSIEAELLTSFMNVDASFMRNEACEHFDIVPSSPKKGRSSRRSRSSSKNQAAEEVKSLSVSFKNSKDRKVCHGVCKYYSLLSLSEDASEGCRITTITSANDYQYATNPPPLLSEYLWDNFFRM